MSRLSLKISVFEKLSTDKYCDYEKASIKYDNYSVYFKVNSLFLIDKIVLSFAH